MAALQTLRTLVNERLNLAAQEIFGVFTETITQYEEEIQRQRDLLNLVFKPTVKLLKAAEPPQLSACLKEGPSEQQERSTTMHQEEPGPPQVKKEPEELWTSQQGEQLQGLEEADIIKFTFIPVPVKKHDEEKPRSSWFNQTQNEEGSEAEPLAGISTEQMESEPDSEDCGVSDQLSGLNPQTSKTKGKGQSFSVDNQLVYGSTESSGPCCKVCGKSFTNKVSLNKHVRVHPSDCGLCGKHLESEESLKLHREAHSTCSVCGKIFPCIANLERHLRTHTGEKLFSCEVCGKGFSQKAVLKTHMRTHTGEKLFSWLKEGPSEQQERRTRLDREERSTSLGQEKPGPPQVKKEPEELRTSQQGEQLQGLEEADIIKFTFIPVPVKSEHDEEKPQSSWFNQTQNEEGREAEPLAGMSTEQMETESDREDCVISEPDSEDCGVSDQLSGLNPQTSKTEGKGQSFSVDNLYRSTESSGPCCKVCGKTFPNKVSLNRHVRVHPSDCGLCGKHLDSEESLKLHREAHSTCSICGKIFSCISNLERHMRTHTGEKLFSCEVCGKGFSQKAVLKTHMMSHTGEKPFFCAFCGTRFRQKEALKKHMITHTGEKKFRCTVCGKLFSRKAVLVRHMKAHTGEKPFDCPVCCETFRRKDHMQAHMLIHTGEKPYTCSVCGQSFRHLTTFNRHKCQSGESASELLLFGLGDGEHQAREWTGELPLIALGDNFAMVSDIDGY